MDYVDLLLVHFPFKSNGDPCTTEERGEQWKAMEYLQKSGKTRSIGVSHFCRHHMEELLDSALIRPAMN